MNTIKITELLGDGIGPELRESVYAIADALPVDFEFIPFDLSLQNREYGDRELFWPGCRLYEGDEIIHQVSHLDQCKQPKCSYQKNVQF